MTIEFLLPETSLRGGGVGAGLCLGDSVAGCFAVIVEITRATERGSLELSIWGSRDGVEWGARPLTRLPRCFCCGRYQTVFALPDRSLRYLRAGWQVAHCSAGGARPAFTAAVFIQELNPVALSATAAGEHRAA